MTEWNSTRPPPGWRQPIVDLFWDLGKHHGKFIEASFYRDRMHKEQTNKQTNRQTNILLYIYID